MDRQGGRELFLLHLGQGIGYFTQGVFRAGEGQGVGRNSDPSGPVSFRLAPHEFPPDGDGLGGLGLHCNSHLQIVIVRDGDIVGVDVGWVIQPAGQGPVPGPGHRGDVQGEGHVLPADLHKGLFLSAQADGNGVLAQVRDHEAVLRQDLLPLKLDGQVPQAGSTGGVLHIDHVEPQDHGHHNGQDELENLLILFTCPHGASSLPGRIVWSAGHPPDGGEARCAAPGPGFPGTGGGAGSRRC